MEDEDEYSLFDEPIQQDGPGLFEEEDEEPIQQDGPDLFGDDAPAAPDVEAAGGEVARASSSPASAPARPAIPDAPLALYRRYRPDTFADVIGQEHVTVPLQRALENNKVGHAYLFSGPRGCGKTTSARILARCLNCEQGPTATPCGECQSCIDLARGGPGSIDVIEIDAASHGGVDDARDLRERAFFAPVASRYKIYIVDEAHMVTPAGFNALLKLVEEPPPHAKFIFATTEPEKVIGTIRSRTHHYPFRLVPPKTLVTYLHEICEAEGVDIDPMVLPLVVRAGAGSVRDSLSVLDQLLGGAGEDGVEYSQAAALLGYTPESLLDDIVDAFAAGDSSGVFKTIDRVIEVGQDPRRFAEDLLRRLRDLVILAAVPTAAEDGILQVPEDQAERLKTQAAAMGSGELTRAAEVIAVGLTEMRGPTAPRLHLELMAARVLLPEADTDERGLHARMDRLERRVGMMSSGEAAAPTTQPAEARDWVDVPGRATNPPSQIAEDAPSEPTRQRPAGQRPANTQRPAGEPPAGRPSGAPSAQRPAGQAPAQRPTTQPQASVPSQTPATSAPSGAATGKAGQLTTEELRRAWPNVLDEVKRRRRFTYMLLSQNARVQEVRDGMLVLGFVNPGARDNFGRGGSSDLLAHAIIEVLGVELRIQGVVAEGAAPERGQREAGAPVVDRQPAPRPEPQQPAPEPEPDDGQLSSDDEEFDGTHNAAELLGREFGAEIISVDDGTQSQE